MKYFYVGETDTNITREEYYLNNPDFCKVGIGLRTKTRILEQKLRFFDFLEFILIKSELGIKLMSGSINDLDLGQNLIPKITFTETDLKAFADEFELTENKLHQFLHNCFKKNRIYKKKDIYGLTLKSRNVDLTNLDGSNYPCLHLYSKLHSH